MWNIEKTVNKGDYLYAVVKGHPGASKYGYILYHRVVMQNHLGRLLMANEVVHHIDGNKFNNDISNLELMDSKRHAKLHKLKHGRKYVLLKCPECGKLFEIAHNLSFLSKGMSASFCSRHCNGVFSRKKQLRGLTKDMQLAIADNLVKIFIKYTNDNSDSKCTQQAI